MAPWRARSRGRHRISEVRVTGREFFTAQSVSQALAGFRPSRRTRMETVPSRSGPRPGAGLTGGVGFSRYPASPGRPWTATRCAPPTRTAPATPFRPTLELAGAVRMGAAADIAVRSGTAVQIPTGAAISSDALIPILDGLCSLNHPSANF